MRAVYIYTLSHISVSGKDVANIAFTTMLSKVTDMKLSRLSVPESSPPGASSQSSIVIVPWLQWLGPIANQRLSVKCLDAMDVLLIESISAQLYAHDTSADS